MSKTWTCIYCSFANDCLKIVCMNCRSSKLQQHMEQENSNNKLNLSKQHHALQVTLIKLTSLLNDPCFKKTLIHYSPIDIVFTIFRLKYQWRLYLSRNQVFLIPQKITVKQNDMVHWRFTQWYIPPSVPLELCRMSPCFVFYNFAYKISWRDFNEVRTIVGNIKKWRENYEI